MSELDLDELKTALETRLASVVDGRESLGATKDWARSLVGDELPSPGDRMNLCSQHVFVVEILEVLLYHSEFDVSLTRNDAVGWLLWIRNPIPLGGAARDLAALPGSPIHLVERGGGAAPYIQDGLGMCHGWLIESDPPGIWFSSWWPDVQVPSSSHIQFRPDGEINAAATALFETLAIDENDLTWIHPDVALEKLPEWTLLRTDDNANCIAVMTTRSRTKAAARMAAMESTGHRQLYEVVAGRR